MVRHGFRRHPHEQMSHNQNPVLKRLTQNHVKKQEGGRYLWLGLPLTRLHLPSSGSMALEVPQRAKHVARASRWLAPGALSCAGATGRGAGAGTGCCCCGFGLSRRARERCGPPNWRGRRSDLGVSPESGPGQRSTLEISVKFSGCSAVQSTPLRFRPRIA